MRLASFDDDRLGLVREDRVLDITAAVEALPAVRWPPPPGDPLIRHLDAVAAAAESLAAGAASRPMDAVTLRSPVRAPSKVIAAPVNYRKHLEESRADEEINRGAHVRTIDEYGVFLKSSTSVIGAGEPVRLPFDNRRIDHEVELAVVIGREGKAIPRDRAFDHVAGYAIGLDMSVRGTEDRSWRKSHDSFTVIGPWLVTRDELPDIGALDFGLAVNGTTRQQSNTGLLIWDVPKLIEYASATYRLYPGDIILSGTPEGVAPVGPGDRMDCWFEGIGKMSVAVA